MIKRSRVQVPAGAASELSSPVSSFCADSYFGFRSTPVLPQEHVKDSRHSTKSEWQVTAEQTVPLRMLLQIK